jgi:hypothetical protein
MKALLLAGLALSLAGNIALLALTPKANSAPDRVPTEAPSTTPFATAERSAADEPDATGDHLGLQPVRWRQPRSAAELPQLAADLRAAGFPAHLVRLAVREAHFKLNEQRDPLVAAPYWQFLSPELQIASSDYRRELDTALDAVIGPNTDYAASLDPMRRQQRYGSLSDAKINALRVAEREYDSLRTELQHQNRTDHFTRESYEALQAAESSLLNDHLVSLASTLTTEELLSYQLRNAPDTRRISGQVSDIDLNEAEFAQLYQIQTTFDAANPQFRPGTIPQTEFLARQVAIKARNEQARSVLGEDRFYTYLAAGDVAFRRLTAVSAEHPSFTPAIAYQVTQLRQEASETIAALSQQRPVNRDAINAAQAAFVSRFEALAGPAADAVRKQSGYSILTPRRGSPNTSQPPRN